MACNVYAVHRSCTERGKKQAALEIFKECFLVSCTGILEYVAIGVLGGLVRTNHCYRYQFVLTNRFSKMVRTLALKRITADAVARAFVTHWVFVFGLLVHLLSDNGSHITSNVVQDPCRVFGRKNMFITTYHLQCNGQVQ